jgi:NACHT domain
VLSNWTRADLLSLVAAVAGVIAIVGPVWFVVVRVAKAGSLRAGRSERKYGAWFIRRWGTYENPYLDDKEDLDLSNTYVSLSLRPPDSDQETRTAAARVLAHKDGGNLIIEGDPGSGKSTLLKAYGVGALKRQRGPLRRGHHDDDQVPFIVALRKLARWLDGRLGLAEYLVQEVLVSGAGMTTAEATEFLRYVLTEGRALVMLDGLDEVTTDRQPAVLEAVYRFTDDQDPQLPTGRARLVVTCRRQNFIALRDRWVPAVAPTVSTLVPLRNSEIFAYLDKLRAKFKAAGGPESFMNAVRVSGTLDLHRTPLILAMSVGLYARKDFYEIPNSIAKLYRTMIEEMLDRQRFRHDPIGAPVVLPVDDKYRFLREFALARALREGFDDFARSDMLASATVLAPSLREARDPEALVAEVADRSGLVNDVSEAGHYVFAHRSLHEHLVAEELLALPDGEKTLLDRAGDPEWRQVVLFFAASLEQRRADAFLPELADRNVTLAGHCLAGSVPSDDVARPVLDRLVTDDAAHLAALVAATTSPRRSVQEMAVSRLENLLHRSMETVRRAFRGDVEGMLPLLGSLAASNAARIAALVPQIVANVPDDPRLVEPLWRCLIVPGIEHDPAGRIVVERLLTIAMDPDGFEALQRQEPYTRPFLDAALRKRAYPFENGLPTSCNLVTLLAWAEHLGVQPVEPNRFFKAKGAARLARVEVDKRRTIGFSLFWPARVVSLLAAAGSVVAAGSVLVINWRFVLLPFGWWTAIISLLLEVLSFVLIALFSAWAERLPKELRTARFVGRYGDVRNCAHFAYPPRSDFFEVASVFGPAAVYAVFVPGLVASGWPSFWFFAFVAPLLLFWCPLLGLFYRDVRIYPYRPNLYIDMYDDPRSRLWLTRPS